MKEHSFIQNNLRYGSHLFYVTVILFLCSFIFFEVVHAQTIPTESQISSPSQTTLPLLFLITLDPSVPRPLDPVTATISNETFPETGLSIKWYIDGTLIGTGSTTTFSFTAPQEERRFIIKAVITLPDGRTATQTMETSTIDLNSITTIKKNLDDQLRNLETLYGPLDGPLGNAGSDETALPFSLVSDNDNPGPFETITFRISSTIFDPNRTFIRWFQDGKKSDEGIGKTNFSIQTGPVGIKKTLRVQIIVSGKTFETVRVIIPFSMSLYWWTDTAVPHWYKGKALPSQNNLVHISAFAPTGLSEQKNFIFFWTYNNGLQQTESGAGKQTFDFRPRIARLSDTISVRVQNQNKTLSFETGTTIKNVDPEIRFCVVDSISGCSRGTKTVVVRGGDSLDVAANPFYFGKNETSFLKYEWNIGGQEPNIKATTRPHMMTIKTPENIKGTIPLSVSVEGIISNLLKKTTLNINLQ